MRAGMIVYQRKSKTGIPILIRYPAINDAEIMRRYINALSRERTYILLQGQQFSKEEEKKYLEETLGRIKSNSAVMLLAFSRGKLVGSADIVLAKGAMRHVGHFGIVVARKFRGQGIGTLLMRLTLREAKKRLAGIK